MALTTSAASRKPICSFGVSPAAGRPRRLNCSAASIMPGFTSWIGLKCWKSSAVSGLTSPSLFVSGRFAIESLLSFVGLSEADDPADLSTQHVADRVKPPSQRREGSCLLRPLIVDGAKGPLGGHCPFVSGNPLVYGP